MAGLDRVRVVNLAAAVAGLSAIVAVGALGVVSLDGDDEAASSTTSAPLPVLETLPLAARSIDAAIELRLPVFDPCRARRRRRARRLRPDGGDRRYRRASTIPGAVRDQRASRRSTRVAGQVCRRDSRSGDRPRRARRAVRRRHHELAGRSRDGDDVHHEQHGQLGRALAGIPDRRCRPRRAPTISRRSSTPSSAGPITNRVLEIGTAVADDGLVEIDDGSDRPPVPRRCRDRR